MGGFNSAPNITIISQELNQPGIKFQALAPGTIFVV